MSTKMEKYKIKSEAVFQIITLVVILYLLHLYFPSFYFNVGFINIKITEAVLTPIYSIPSSLLLYHIDKKLNKWILFLLQLRKGEKWIQPKKYSHDAQMAWRIAMDNNYQGWEEAYQRFNFLRSLTSVQVLCALLFISFCEEVIFRGVLIYFVMLYAQNLILAILLSAVIFAFIHLRFGTHVIPSRFLGGLVFAFNFIIAGTLLAPILAHLVFNALTWKSWRKECSQIYVSYMVS